MDTKELNAYIKNYLENDKTNSAIMLTGAWGSGKSHYIKHELIPYIDKDKKGKCVVVSLYGIKDLKDISKSIYLEVRAKAINKKTEKLSAGKLVAKTIVKGVAGYFGVDLSMSEKDLQKLYDSVNLKNKLIILEDLERCSLSIIEVLGFVNNLVEQDNVKVLLVANENEIIKYKPVEVTSEKDRKTAKFIQEYSESKVYTEETLQYLKIKEKTVSDTIQFAGDTQGAVKSIIKEFSNKKLDIFLAEENLKALYTVLQNYGISNLRSFVFACQKTVDLYNKFTKDYDESFLKSIFIGNIIFSSKLKTDELIKWDGNKDLSFTLGSKDYPLYKFCFNYILSQTFDEKYVELAQNAYKEAQLYDEDKSRNDKDLQKIKSYFVQSEKELLQVITNIETRLDDINDISFYEYGQLANYLFVIKSVLDCDISTILKKILRNLEGRGEKLNCYLLFRFGINITDEQAKTDFNIFQKEIEKALQKNKGAILGFKYTVDDLDRFYNDLYQARGSYIGNNAFAGELDNEKLLDLLKQSSANDIYIIRSIFHCIYSSVNIKDFLEKDKEILLTIKDRVADLYNTYNDFDKIQKLQISWLISDLEKIIQQLS